MTSLKKLILLTIFILLIIVSAAIILFTLNAISAEYFKSFILGGIITSFNALLGFFAIKSGINKPEKVFFQRLFGAIVVRFVLTLIMVAIVLVFLEINRISFIFSILFFYIFYLIIEIIYLNFRQN